MGEAFTYNQQPGGGNREEVQRGRLQGVSGIHKCHRPNKAFSLTSIPQITHLPRLPVHWWRAWATAITHTTVPISSLRCRNPSARTKQARNKCQNENGTTGAIIHSLSEIVEEKIIHKAIIVLFQSSISQYKYMNKAHICNIAINNFRKMKNKVEDK